MANSSLPYIPRNVSSNFNPNCSLVGEWSAEADTTVTLTARLLVGGLSDYWARSNLSQPNATELVAAFLKSDEKEDILDMVYDLTNEKCTEDFCSHLGWQGNADLAGRGMLFNYCIEAGLASLYLFVLAPNRLTQNLSGTFMPRSISTKAFTAFRDSLRTFLDAGSLFSLAMLVATTFIFGDAYNQKNPKKIHYLSNYTVVTSFFMSLWSLLPVILLYNSATNHLRRQVFRRYVWGLLSLFTIATIGLYLGLIFHPPDTYREDSFSSKEEFEDMQQRRFEFDCLDLVQLKDFAITSFVAIGATFLVILAWLLHNPIMKYFPRLQKSQVFHRISHYWWLVSATLSFVAMWAGIGIFVYHRKKLSGARRSGESNKDHEWNFGQVLALSTFLPVLVDWGYSFAKGPEEGLTSLLPKGYVAIQDDNQASQTQKNLPEYNTAGLRLGNYERIIGEA